MDKDTWKAFLGFLEKASLAIQHPALRFLAVFAGIVSAFLLLLGAITAGTQDTQLNQFLFVGAFVVLVIVLALLGVYIWQVEQKRKHEEKIRKHEEKITEGLKSLVRKRIQEEMEIERRDTGPSN